MIFASARSVAMFAIAIATGFATPWLVPPGWLGNIFGACVFLMLVWAVLAAGSAKGDASGRGLGLLSWLLIGTDRPTAEVTDKPALRLFWMTLAYLAAFGLGAFGAAR